MRRFLLFLLTAVLIGGCVPILSMDSKLKLDSDEKWELIVEILIPNDSATMYGMVLQESLNQMINEAQDAGIQATWEKGELDKNGNLPVTIKMNAQGYELLDQEIFGGSQAILVDESDGDRKVIFHLPSGSDLFGDATSASFTLQGGRVVSSNGNQKNGKTIVWENPIGSLDAVMLEPSKASRIPYGLITVGLILVGFAFLQMKGVLHIGSAHPTFSPEKFLVINHRMICSFCGASIPESANFCPQCGEKSLSS
jgi:hypothetical protein